MAYDIQVQPWDIERSEALASFERREHECWTRWREREGLKVSSSLPDTPWRDVAGLPDTCTESQIDGLASLLAPRMLWATGVDYWGREGRQKYRSQPIQEALHGVRSENSSEPERSGCLTFLASSWWTQARVVMNCLTRHPNPNAWLYYACCVGEVGLKARQQIPRPAWSVSEPWPDIGGQTSLHLAVNLAGLRSDVVAVLIGEGADVNARDEIGRTPLVAIGFGDFEVEEGSPRCRLAVIGMLGEAGADPNVFSLKKETMLHRAASRGSVESMVALVHINGDLDAVDVHGHTPLDLLESLSDAESPRLLEMRALWQAKKDTETLLAALPAVDDGSQSGRRRM